MRRLVGDDELEVDRVGNEVMGWVGGGGEEGGREIFYKINFYKKEKKILKNNNYTNLCGYLSSTI